MSVKVAQSCWTLRPHGLYSPWSSSGQNTGVDSRDLPNPGMEPRCPTLQGNSLPAEPWGKPIPTIPLMGLYPEKTTIQKDTYTPPFTAALFTIARAWKQPRCPSADEWIKSLWHTYTMEYYSAIKRNESESVVVRWVNVDMDSEISSLASGDLRTRARTVE